MTARILSDDWSMIGQTCLILDPQPRPGSCVALCCVDGEPVLVAWADLVMV